MDWVSITSACSRRKAVLYKHCGLGNSGRRRKREAQPEKSLLILCHKAKGRAVEVPSHSAQPHRVSQHKAPVKETGLVLFLHWGEPGVAQA